MATNGQPRRTVAEWEQRVGEQVRDLRIRAGLTQVELARRANVSTSAVQSLEAGHGSRLATLVAVLRTVGRVDVLEQLAPEVTISPLQMLAEQQRRSRREAQPKRRVRVSSAARKSLGSAPGSP